MQPDAIASNAVIEQPVAEATGSRKRARDNSFSDTQWCDISCSRRSGKVRRIQSVPIDNLNWRQLRTVCSRLKMKNVRKLKKADMLAALHDHCRRQNGFDKETSPKQSGSKKHKKMASEGPASIVVKPKRRRSKSLKKEAPKVPEWIVLGKKEDTSGGGKRAGKEEALAIEDKSDSDGSTMGVAQKLDRLMDPMNKFNQAHTELVQVQMKYFRLKSERMEVEHKALMKKSMLEQYETTTKTMKTIQQWIREENDEEQRLKFQDDLTLVIGLREELIREMKESC